MANTFLGRLGGLLGKESPITIGVLSTRVGPLDYYGTMQVRGLNLGIEFAGGTELQLKFVDPPDGAGASDRRSHRRAAAGIADSQPQRVRGPLPAIGVRSPHCGNLKSR